MLSMKGAHAEEKAMRSTVNVLLSLLPKSVLLSVPEKEHGFGCQLERIPLWLEDMIWDRSPNFPSSFLYSPDTESCPDLSRL